MSQFIEGLESRTFLSAAPVTKATIAADAKSVTSASAAVKAELKAAKAAFSADTKAISADLKAVSDKTNRKSDAALVKTLKADGNAALAGLKKDASTLTTTGTAAAKRAAKDVAALLKKPSNAGLQLKVAADVATLGSVSVAPLTKITADLQALGVNVDLANITAANPSSSKLAADAQLVRNHFAAVISTLTANDSTFTAALATLADAASSAPTTTPTSTGLINLVGTYSGSAVVSGGPRNGNVNFLTLNITSQSATGALTGTASFTQNGGAQISMNFTGNARKDPTPYSNAILTGTLTDPTTPGRGMTLTFNAFLASNTNKLVLQGTYTGTGGIDNANFTLSQQ